MLLMRVEDVFLGGAMGRKKLKDNVNGRESCRRRRRKYKRLNKKKNESETQEEEEEECVEGGKMGESGVWEERNVNQQAAGWWSALLANRGWASLG